MRKSFVSIAGTLLALAACTDGTRFVAPKDVSPDGASLAAASGASGGIPGRYIIVFKTSVADPSGKAYKELTEHGGKLKHLYKAALKGFAAELSPLALAALRADPEVAYVEQDQVMRAIGTQTNATWGLDRVDQRSLPLDKSYTYNATGKDVRAYIIDTGIRLDHTEFGGRAVSGRDVIDGVLPADDCNGHGTHVASTVGGSTYGVAKGVTLYAVRVLDCSGSGTTSGVIAGIDWVTSQKTATPSIPMVANMSLGGGASTALDDAVRRSIGAGITYAIAAGNDGLPACWYSPARVTEALTVGASDATDAIPGWSNYGSCLDLFAPGVGVTSAWHTSATAINTISGTSMAAPHVAGASALYLETNKPATPAAVAQALKSNATTGVLSGLAAGDPDKLLYTAFINAGAPPPGTPPPANQAPTAKFTHSCTNLTCSFTDQSTDADGSITGWSWNFGDGATSTVQSPSHSYAAAGTYTVTLTVTDNSAATGASSQSVTVTSPPATSITLTTRGYSDEDNFVDLRWSGATSGKVDIYRNGSRIGTKSNSGSWTNDLGSKTGTFRYKVCEAGKTVCSNESSVTF